jgi:acyl-CoA reductase-like NAD-dependent aldehyde dehydrogenase
VVILKLNPVNAHIGPLLEKVLEGFIQRGFLGIVYGDANVGDYICNHSLVEEIHMTGSDKTFEAIVFGTGSEGIKRKQERKPLNTKPVTGELGNVTPVIVVPGPWTPKDINEYAEHIATWLVANAGFACLTPRVIVQHTSWSQKDTLSSAIKAKLEQVPTRKAYYPGAFEIYNDFLSAHPQAVQIGNVKDDQLPWTLISDVDPKNTNDIVFKREGFGSLTAEISLEGNSVEEYLQEAVEFVNKNLWGSLCAIMVVHPKSLENPKTSQVVNRAITELNYGTISINMLAFYSTYFMVCPWGAIPGHDIYDIQSGIGKNFNFLMFDQPEKVVLKAPFYRLDPLTIGSKQAHIFAEKLAKFEAYPSFFRFLGLMVAALSA